MKVARNLPFGQVGKTHASLPNRVGGCGAGRTLPLRSQTSGRFGLGGRGARSPGERRNRYLRKDCGYHCGGRSVPSHICDPFAEPKTPVHSHAVVAEGERTGGMDHAHGGHEAGHAAPSTEQAHAMAHDHAGMSMDAMVRDMRNRFLVALVLTIPIALWSPLGRSLLGTELPTPFSLDVNICQRRPSGAP